MLDLGKDVALSYARTDRLEFVPGLQFRVSPVDGGSVNAFLAAALTRVMRAAVPIPAVVSASVLHSATVGGSVKGVVGPL